MKITGTRSSVKFDLEDGYVIIANDGLFCLFLDNSILVINI